MVHRGLHVATSAESPLKHIGGLLSSTDTLEALLQRRNDAGIPRFMTRQAQFGFRFQASRATTEADGSGSPRKGQEAPSPTEDRPDLSFQGLHMVLEVVRPTVYNAAWIYKHLQQYDSVLDQVWGAGVPPSAMPGWACEGGSRPAASVGLNSVCRRLGCPPAPTPQRPYGPNASPSPFPTHSVPTNPPPPRPLCSL